MCELSTEARCLARLERAGRNDEDFALELPASIVQASSELGTPQKTNPRAEEAIMNPGDERRHVEHSDHEERSEGWSLSLIHI